MGKDNNLKDFCTDIADAIREKKGTTDLINPQDFADEIRSIEGDGGTELIDALVDRTITEYENDTVTVIPQYLFAYCTLLERLSLPNVVTLEPLSIAHCTSLVELNLPMVEDIHSQALRNTPFTSIDFPKLKNIAVYAFAGCKNLTTFILRNSEVCNLYSTNAFSGTIVGDGDGYIYVPSDLVDTYKTATNWSAFADKIKSLDELPV